MPQQIHRIVLTVYLVSLPSFLGCRVRQLLQLLTSLYRKVRDTYGYWQRMDQGAMACWLSTVHGYRLDEMEGISGGGFLSLKKTAGGSLLVERQRAEE